jgi:2-amino-4-hydroxy-6-hydroxymethyldihydropteridine diphosphokinase
VPAASLSIGSNLGDRAAHLQAGIDLIAEFVTLLGVSSIYETAPMYLIDQPPFFNAALLVQTELGPLGLLRAVKKVEATLGRVERVRYGPRDIDLDLVSYGALSYRFWRGDKEVLHVPHPLLAERRFVLQPLSEVAPGLVLPGLGSVEELLCRTSSQAGQIRRVTDAVLSISGA